MTLSIVQLPVKMLQSSGKVMVKRFVRPYSLWLGRHPLHAAELGGLLLTLLGLLGSGFGLSNLFWHEDALTQLAAGGSIAGLSLLLWWLSVVADPALVRAAMPVRIPYKAPQRANRIRRYLWVMFLPLGLLLTFLSLAHVAVGLLTPPHEWRLGAYLPLPAGAWLIVAITCGSFPGPADWGEFYHTHRDKAALGLLVLTLAIGFAGPFPAATGPLSLAAVLAGATSLRWLTQDGAWRWCTRRRLLTGALALMGVNLCAVIGQWLGTITAIMALCMVLADGAVILFLTYRRPFVRIALAAALLIEVGWVNGLYPYKLSYPGMDEYYRDKSAHVDFNAGAADPVRSEAQEAVQAEVPNASTLDAKIEKALKAYEQREVFFDDKTRDDLYSLLFERANVRFLQGEHAGSLADTSMLLKIAPFGDHPLAGYTWLLQALAHIRVGRSEEAKVDIKSSSLVSPQAVKDDKFNQFKKMVNEQLLLLLRNRADRRLEDGDFEGAMADADAAIQFERTSDIAILTRARLREVAGDYDQARDDLDQAIAFNEKSSRAHRARAEFFVHRRNLTYAIEDYSEAIGLNPDNPELFEERALCYERLGKADLDAADRDSARRLRGPSIGSPLVGDDQALEAWLWENGPGKPVLVVASASGGGIAAAYYTARCLAALEAKCPEFPRRLRLVTGASGGVVGAAVYVARLAAASGRSEPTGPSAADDVGKDSITPVVRQMFLSDLAGGFWPGRLNNDRGRVLERTWDENTAGTTGRPLASLAEDERRGKRPSLVISPMLIEDAKFLLISNLDLKGLNGHEEFAKRFPKAYESLALGTALRMNAAFPYVTPAVSLPTTKPRRVVDAGYLDNYGVRLASAWIARHRVWLYENTAGVVLVQIRAYPTPPAPDAAATSDTIWAGWRFLTAPMEGVSAARQDAMRGNNDRAVEGLMDWLNSGPRGPRFFRTVVLESDQELPLGWSLTANDRARIDSAVSRAQGKIHEVCEAIKSTR